MKTLKITTSRIAEICGVSQGTVDRALNGRPDIKAETRERILDAAKRYGYREPITAVTKKIKGQIGVIVFDLNNEYFAELITELEYAMRSEALGAVVMMSHYDKRYEIECIRNLYNMGVDGIIMCSVNGGIEFDNYLKLFDIPIVAVGNKTSSLPFVGIDDFVAMRQLTLKVLNQNPRKVIYFSPAINYPDAYAQRLRYEGFLNAVGDNPYETVTNISEIRTDYGQDVAIICSTDYYALKVYFKDCGAKIFGFDNVSAIDKYKLKITSVGYSTAEIARRALRVIKNKEKEGYIVRHYIVER